MPVVPSRPLLRRTRCAAALALALASALPSAARAEDFEVAPWLGWAAGVQWRQQKQSDFFSVNAGLDTTAPVTGFGGGYGGAIEVRLGPWLAFHYPIDRGASGEGGLTMVVTQTEHASWGTFAVRFGAGYGGDREAHLHVTVWGGVRFVPARAGQAPRGDIAKVTGVRLVATYRPTVAPVEAAQLVFGVEFEPDYFLPPYSLFKWGGKH